MRRRNVKVQGRIYCPRCHAVYSILTAIEDALEFDAPLHAADADSIGDCVRCGGEVEVLELSEELREYLRRLDDDFEPWRK